MDGRFFGACFSIFGHKEGAVAPQMITHLFCNSPFFVLAEIKSSNMHTIMYKFLLG